MTRQTRWWTWAGPTVLAAAVVLLLGGIDASAQKRGGVLRIANLGEPPTLDAHWTTATLTEVLTNHLYEGLYALDEGYRPIPMLAEALPAVSPDGLTYTIRLRQGIKFHNGKEMTSDDVVASLKRWTQQSQYGRALAAVLAEMRATGKHAIELKLKQKSAAVVVALAAPNNFGAIYPKEIAEKFPPAEKATEFVGTGPFKLAEWKPDQYIRMVRFDDYK
ncbi:MAG: ABC transporter substrate-binding protein, partial [Candidatus Rokuibacteriota bacterium]